MFPGSILYTPLPYSYRCTVIKCKHLRPRKECGAAGNKPIAASDHQYIVPRADLRVGCHYMLCKCVFSLCNKLCHIILDHYPVGGRRQGRMKPAGSFNPQGQPSVRGTDRCKPDPIVQYLANPSRSGEQKRALFGKERSTAQAPELVISDRLNPGERTVL